MLQLNYEVIETPFRYPFQTHKGLKTHQRSLVVSLGLGHLRGYGEAPAISYYGVTTDDMVAMLEQKRSAIERYALTEPGRFWHFLHHLIPGAHFLTAALDIAAWDLFAKMRRMPLYKALGIAWATPPVSDYTIGLGHIDETLDKIAQKPWPIYKIKMGGTDDIATLRELRKHTSVPIRLDANEGWTYEQTRDYLPALQELNVSMLEQPLPKNETDNMRQLKAQSPIPIFADESCVTEGDVAQCAHTFHGINIKLTKCGGITPALRMIDQAKTLGLKVMLGTMSENSIGTAALAHLSPLADELDADGPLLLHSDGWLGLTYTSEGHLKITDQSGLGIYRSKQ